MENRKPKDTEDILEFVKSKWKLSIQEFDVLESVLVIFQAGDKREIDKIEHLVNDETEELLELLNDREVINYVTENWDFIASDDESGLVDALDDLKFNWVEKVTDTDMIKSLEDDGWNVTIDDFYPRHQADIVTQSDLEEMTELFLNNSQQKRSEMINKMLK